MSKGNELVRTSGQGPGQTLFAFVRHWARRWNDDAVDQAAQNGRNVLVAEAVHSVTARGSASVNAIAQEIGIDQSGASRLVKDAVTAGFLATTPSDLDARQRNAVLTAQGRSLLLDAHRWQEEIFSHLTEGWTEKERAAFHRGMTRILEKSHLFAK